MQTNPVIDPPVVGDPGMMRSQMSTVPVASTISAFPGPLTSVPAGTPLGAAVHTIRYEAEGIGNEYTEIAPMMVGAFPIEFLGGYPYEGLMTAGQSQHMLHQCSNSFSRNAEFVVTNFDMFRRRNVSQGVAKMFKSDPESMNELTEALQDPDFKEL